MTFVFVTDLCKPLPELARIVETTQTSIVPTQSQEVLPTPPPVSTIPTQIEPQTDEVLANIRALSKRDLRKILTPLGVQQKRNGVEIAKDMAIAQVTRIYKDNPQKTIAILRQKLPNKFSSPTNPSVQLTQTA